MGVSNISIALVAIAFLSFLIFVVVSLVGMPASLIPYVYAPTLSFRHVVIALAACTVAAGIGLSPRQPLLLIPVGLFLLIFGKKIVGDAYANGTSGAALVFGLILGGLVWAIKP